MKKSYRSKVEMAVFLPLLTLLTVIAYLLVTSKIWWLALLTVLAILFIIYLYLFTSYEFTVDRRLKVRSGFLFEKNIYINSIKKIKQTRNVDASPALSTDRIQIFYNRYETIIISPDDKKSFISQLKEMNPKITVV